MRLQRRQTRFLLSSFAIGAFSAFVAAGLLDRIHFDTAVKMHDQQALITYSSKALEVRDRFDRRLADETRAAREQAENAAREKLAAAAEQLRITQQLAETRQELLDVKNRELQELSTAKEKSADVKPDSYPTEGRGTHPGTYAGAPRNSETQFRYVSWEADARRAEFARQIAAEAAAKKKPKGPVYLNTPRGRVILVPAETR
jgi:flagellar biosynthesis GTPase FlhF